MAERYRRHRQKRACRRLPKAARITFNEENMAARQHVSNRGRITFNENNIQRQYFAFPYPHMCYIRENAYADTQLKLRQTCKFFHKWSPMFIVENLFFGYEPSPNADKWDLYVQNYEEMPIIDVVKNGIIFDTYDKRMISKIHRCEAKEIWLFPKCELSMEDVLFFTQSGMVQKWCSFNANIRDENGKVISLEALLFLLPNAKDVSLKVQDVKQENSSKIVPQNNKIEDLTLDFSGPINADQLYEILKNVLAPNAYLFVKFADLTEETYVATFKDEMKAKMKTWKPQNEMPTLWIY